MGLFPMCISSYITPISYTHPHPYTYREKERERRKKREEEKRGKAIEKGGERNLRELNQSKRKPFVKLEEDWKKVKNLNP